MRIEIKRFIVRKLELIIRYNRYFFKTNKIQWFVQGKINIFFAWIIRFTKKKVSDNLLIQKYINIFLSLRKLKRNLN